MKNNHESKLLCINPGCLSHCQIELRPVARGLPSEWCFVNGTRSSVTKDLLRNFDPKSDDNLCLRCSGAVEISKHKKPLAVVNQQRHSIMDLNEMAKRIHQANINWWKDINTGEPIIRSKFELTALIVTEISEALEGERKDLMDDKLPHRKMAEVEMADAYIRILDYAGGFKINIQHVVVALESVSKPDDIYWIMRQAIQIPLYGDKETSFTLSYIEQYCSKYGYDLFGAIDEKLAFNANRADHKHEHRRAEGGKKF